MRTTRLLPVVGAALAAGAVLCASSADAWAQDVPYGSATAKPKAPPAAPAPTPKSPAAPQATPAAPPGAPPAAPPVAAATAVVVALAPGAPASTGKPPVAVPKVPAAPVAAAASSGAPNVPAPVAAPTNAAPGAPAALDPTAFFHSSLAPFGTWVTDPSFGEVWVPSASAVGDDFAPYRTNGHWVVNDRDEWAWASDFAWGQIPFHYGRWLWRAPSTDTAAVAAPLRGWAWVPGTEYAPAWVVWRLPEPGTEYVGWAPLAPSEATVASNGTTVRPGTLPFYFVESAHLFDPALVQHVVGEMKLANALLGHSHILPSQRSASGFVPATPSVIDARVPAATVPSARAPRRMFTFASRTAPVAVANGPATVTVTLAPEACTGAHLARGWRGAPNCAPLPPAATNGARPVAAGPGTPAPANAPPRINPAVMQKRAPHGTPAPAVPPAPPVDDPLRARH